MKKVFVLFFIVFSLPVSGEIITDFSNLCGTGYHYIHAVPKSDECESGEFLPANSVQCVSCPDGYTCAGGTYSYNPTLAQGIVKDANNPYISSNTHHTCSANLGHIMHATRTANVINLRWYDRDTELTVQPAAQSCTYGEKITLPDTIPTRQGYIFSGWRLIRKNN